MLCDIWEVDRYLDNNSPEEGNSSESFSFLLFIGTKIYGLFTQQK